MERKIVTKYNIFLRKQRFLVLEDYDPRIHALYFCPQLYKADADDRLVALEGEEIGRLLAQSLQDGVVEKKPWYQPSTELPIQPIITTSMEMDLDTVVVDGPMPKSPVRNSSSETAHSRGLLKTDGHGPDQPREPAASGAAQPVGT